MHVHLSILFIIWHSEISICGTKGAVEGDLYLEIAQLLLFISFTNLLSPLHFFLFQVYFYHIFIHTQNNGLTS